VNAIYVWGVARLAGAGVLLRIEDHDRIRSRRVFEEALIEDLDWLGFRPDSGRYPPLRQSDDDAPYVAALDRLRRTHHVYVCDCSRRAIGGERYDGRCRRRGLADGPGRGLRVEIDDEAERFEDLLCGPVVQQPSKQCGDILLRDRDGHWTYQFAVTVDDLRHEITLIVRGSDLLSSTGRQIKLARMLGRETAASFLHHPLVMKTSTEKLSKADGDTGVRDLRTSGMRPDEVIGRAAAAVGLLPGPRAVAAADVSELFQGMVLRRTYSP
jgi:glutamyl-tRNA synthetase/glutamyl-Q tRNA(Asp) synthetase